MKAKKAPKVKGKIPAFMAAKLGKGKVAKGKAVKGKVPYGKKK